MPEPPTTVLPPPASDAAPTTVGAPNGGSPRRRRKLKKLRLALIILGLGTLALISTVFGMMMAVASDLPQLENKAEYKRAKNSIVTGAPATKGAKPEQLAELTGNNNRILVGSGDISPNIKNAVIAIEDRRFYEHEGVDYQGIGRALMQDIRRQGAVQGGSTITQQFVKNALAAQNKRSVFEKLREAALAYHLERKWSKQKVLTEYLNSVYFGNGAYGVEAAVRTYFSHDAPVAQEESDPTDTSNSGATLNDHAARDVTPAEAALLGAVISSPSLYDPVENPKTSLRQRNAVLARMRAQGFITEGQYAEGIRTPLPTENEIRPPQPDSKQPYFTSWLTQQLVDRYKAPAVFSGGLNVTTTLDPELQAAAERAINGRLAGVGPSASMVAIDNHSGEVKAMVGGSDFATKPFNLATNGHRQPGSAFKPFTLIRALEDGVSPDQTFVSEPKTFPVPGSPGEKFHVNNYEDSYAGVASLRTATATSDNSVFAQLGLKTGTKRIARLAQRMGVQTKVSTNPAMTLGGLAEGVTPLEMAYAYSTIANRGVRVSGSLASPSGPVAIQRVQGGNRDEVDKRSETRVFPRSVGDTAIELMQGVVDNGTGTAAKLPEFAAGKTGTTENYGDAWFVGFNKDMTVAVWVGYPDGLKPMKTEFHGGPVSGGTFPAEIWHDFMTSWIGIRDGRRAADGKKKDGSETSTTTTAVPQTTAPVPSATTPTTPAPATPDQNATPTQKNQQQAPTQQKTPTQQAPKQTPAPTPKATPPATPTPAEPQGGGGTGGGATSGGGAAPG